MLFRYLHCRSREKRHSSPDRFMADTAREPITSADEVKTTELVTISRPAVVGTLAEGLGNEARLPDISLHPPAPCRVVACSTCASWNGRHESACEGLGRISSWATDAVKLNNPVIDPNARRLATRRTELRSDIESNEGALIDYGKGFRVGKPISTSRAEGGVNQLVNTCMNKRRQMRWPPRGTHRLLQVRAAVLDGRFRPQAIQLAA